MDVHKEIITVACASEVEDIRVAGTIANTAAALDAMIRKLVSGGKRPMFVADMSFAAACATWALPAWWRRHR